MSRWPERDFARFLELDAAGFSARQIAAEMRVSDRTVVRWRRDAGRSGETWPAHPVADRARAAVLLEEECPVAEVARTVGADFHTVVRWFPDARRMSRSEVGQLRAMYSKAARRGVSVRVSDRKAS